MRVLIAAVGRLKDGPERELSDRYIARLRQSGRSLGLSPIEVLEISEGREATVELRRADEGARLLKLCQGCELSFVLDERGKYFTSRAFASELGRARDSSLKGIAFVIGGPDGHGEAVKSNSNMLISLGAITLPHGLARIVLAEQLYRAVTIISGHPYHRD